MIVIPAIDLRGGRAVRLFRGDPDAETEYATEPLEVAKRFEEDGARRLHVVDLDAALGTGDNRESVREIIRNVAIPVQLGGGIRSMAALDLTRFSLWAHGPLILSTSNKPPTRR